MQFDSEKNITENAQENDTQVNLKKTHYKTGNNSRLKLSRYFLKKSISFHRFQLLIYIIITMEMLCYMPPTSFSKIYKL